MLYATWVLIGPALVWEVSLSLVWLMLPMGCLKVLPESSWVLLAGGFVVVCGLNHTKFKILKSMHIQSSVWWLGHWR